MTAASPVEPSGWKLRLRALMLRAADVRRIHIVGCARSGTTMLHYSMIAFADTTLIDEEVSVLWAPALRDTAALVKDRLTGGPSVLVTKREYGWFEPRQLDRLIGCTRRERIGVIYIVRDPRDVLTSRHARDPSRRFYVEPERWQASVRAGDDLFARLDSYPHKLTLKYEDVVTDPATAETALASTFGLSLRPGIASIGRLKDNLEKLEASTRMAAFMQNIRNFDPTTIGRWKRNPEQVAYLEKLLTDSPIAEELDRFMERYGYRSEEG